MGRLVERIQQRLARFEFEALFREDLGWNRSFVNIDPQVPHYVKCIAQQGLTSVWLSTAWPPETPLTTAIQSLEKPLNEVGSDRLLIITTADATRSLWCWPTGAADALVWRSRVIVWGQEDRAWATHLARLHCQYWNPEQRLATTLNRLDIPLMAERFVGFQQSWQALTEALTPLPRVVDRRRYGLILLLRLIAIAALQQRSYLNNDEWYLHNQFGQSQQQGRDRFFHTTLQPLCQQGFSLPLEERPPGFQARFGAIPFLPTGPFTAGELDLSWGQRPIPDAAFEPALTWLGDLLMESTTEVVNWLPEIFEKAINSRDGVGLVTPEPILWALSDRTLNATLLDRATALIGQSYRSVEHLLIALTPAQAEILLAALGQLTLLDPACGSGRYLRVALHQLLYLAQGLTAVAGLSEASTGPDWVQPTPYGTVNEAAVSSGLGLYRHLASHSLYGVDLWPEAVDMARLQGFLTGVQHTCHPQELASLPDLTLTILHGNALIGLISVDSERFDQITAKGRRSANPSSVEDEPPRQGNLLQPLMAETYQTILAERQVRLEHYRSQTQLLAETGSVPAYAQADFLRDRLEDLNQIAQAKLTHLLWSEASQQLGIRVPSPDDTGHRRSRPLTLADVEALAPFHWGFYMHGLLRDRGGFDLILSHFPDGAVQPTEASFLDAHQDLFEAKNVAPSTFLHNHKQVLTIDPDLTLAWASYRGQFALPSQYFRRSGHYPHSGQSHPGQTQRLYWSRLFLERSLQLLRPGGRCGVVLTPFWAAANSAPLRHWLETEAKLGNVVDIANHRGLWPDLPPRTSISLLWLKKQERTQCSPYSAYTGANKAPTVSTLDALLQRLIHLAE
jgi:hypothetical protein